MLWNDSAAHRRHEGNRGQIGDALGTALVVVPLERKKSMGQKNIPFNRTDILSVSQLQAVWLKKINLGIIVLVVGISLMASFMALLYAGVDIRVWLPESACMLIGFIVSSVGYIGIWLLLVPEPKNKKTFWYLRWPLRMLIIINLGSIAWEIFNPAIEIGKDPIVWQFVSTIVFMVPVLLLFMFLSRLASQLKIKKPRKSFVVLTQIIAVLEILVLVVTISGYTASAEARSSTQVAAEASNTPNYIGIGLWVAFFAWLGMTLLKFAKQIRKIADEKIKENYSDNDL